MIDWLEELDRLEQKATPGGWSACGLELTPGGFSTCGLGPDAIWNGTASILSGDACIANTPPAGDIEDQGAAQVCINMEFIAESRNHARDMIDGIKLLRRANDKIPCQCSHASRGDCLSCEIEIVCLRLWP